MNLENVLREVGFGEKEAKIYLALLELQEALPGTVAKRSGVKRPTTYVVLEQLQQKGVVSRVRKGKALYFRALEPGALLEAEQSKCSALELALPELQTLTKNSDATPQMTVFEGKRGITKIMDDTLTSKTEILCWADVKHAIENCWKEDYHSAYTQKRLAKKLSLRGIFAYDQMALQFKKTGLNDQLREVYLIPKEKFPLQNEVNIYDNKVAIFSYNDMIGVIIENKNVAETQRSIFKLGFEYAKILEQQVLTDADRRFLAEGNAPALKAIGA